MQVLSDTPGLEAFAILELILKSLDNFTTGCEQADDISSSCG